MAKPAKYVYKPLLQKKSLIKSESSDSTQAPIEASKNYLPIRILNLFAGELGNSLKGELANRQDESYEALSYHWGNDSDPVPPLLIHEKGCVYQIRLTRNLESALRHLRHRSSLRRLWVDAICIDQEDNRDKGSQIPFMGRIYAEATNVCVWLGDPSADSQMAFDMVESISRISDLDQLIDEKYTDSWAAVFSLMKRDWFGRRWVVQEIAFAKSATVHCGRACAEWSEWTDIMTIFASRAEDISTLFQSARNCKYRFDFLGNVEAHGANRLAQMGSRLFRKSDDGRKFEPLLSLEALVFTLSAFKATKPHDIIYAVLSLAGDIIVTAEPAYASEKVHDSVTRREPIEAKAWSRDAFKSQEGTLQAAEGDEIAPSEEPEDIHEHAGSSAGTHAPSNESQRRNVERFLVERFSGLLRNRLRQKTFRVDYEKKTFYDVCKDFVARSIKSSQSLDILCRPWAPDVEDLPDGDRDELPSWICPLSKSPFRSGPDGKYGRLNADLLVGEPQSRLKLYNAAHRTVPELHSFFDRSLYVHGFVFDTVKDMKYPAIGGNIPHEWLAFGGWSNFKERPPESFWRILVADRDEEGNDPPSYYRPACRQSFSQRVAGGFLNTANVINDNTRSKIITDYLKRVQSVVWMKKLMKSAGHDGESLIGLVPSEAEKGDLICILRGCSVPVLLRKTVDGDSEYYRSESKPTALPRPKFDLGLPKSTIPHQSPSSGISMKDDRMAEDEETVENSTEDEADALRSKMRLSREKVCVPKAVLAFKLSIPCRLIGECYIHGMMDGEAFRLRDKWNINEAEFELR